MHRMNREMVREAADALGEADIVCLLIDISQPFGKGEAFLLDLVAKAKQPKIALLNKIDLVKKNKLLPILERYGKEGIFDAIIPISAETGDGCESLLEGALEDAAGGRTALRQGAPDDPPRALPGRRAHPREDPARDPERAAVLDRGAARALGGSGPGQGPAHPRRPPRRARGPEEDPHRPPAARW